mmetsp:Transcript_14479/g.36927  ORF Transcript_14479/g.36927 Transcript_14479/m.36927 type:complete len:425 (-) Transcript_14479:145-1419(-)
MQFGHTKFTQRLTRKVVDLKTFIETEAFQEFREETPFGLELIFDVKLVKGTHQRRETTQHRHVDTIHENTTKETTCRQLCNQIREELKKTFQEHHFVIGDKFLIIFCCRHQWVLIQTTRVDGTKELIAQRHHKVTLERIGDGRWFFALLRLFALLLAGACTLAHLGVPFLFRLHLVRLLLLLTDPVPQSGEFGHLNAFTLQSRRRQVMPGAQADQLQTVRAHQSFLETLKTVHQEEYEGGSLLPAESFKDHTGGERPRDCPIRGGSTVLRRRRRRRRSRRKGQQKNLLKEYSEAVGLSTKTLPGRNFLTELFVDHHHNAHEVSSRNRRRARGRGGHRSGGGGTLQKMRPQITLEVAREFKQNHCLRIKSVRAHVLCVDAFNELCIVGTRSSGACITSPVFERELGEVTAQNLLHGRCMMCSWNT